MTRRRFFVWVLPALWVPTSLISYYHPGDEYGLYVVSSLLGAWFVILGDVGDIHDLWVPLSIAAAGGLVCAALGLLLDKLRVTRVGFLACWLTLAALLVWSQLRDFSSIEEALGKNGSWTAYLSASSNIALTLCLFAFLFGGSLWRIARARPGKTP